MKEESKNQKSRGEESVHNINEVITRLLHTLRYLHDDKSLIVPVKKLGNRPLLFFLCDCCHNFQNAEENRFKGAYKLFVSSLESFIEVWDEYFKPNKKINSGTKLFIENYFIKFVKSFLEREKENADE